MMATSMRPSHPPTRSSLGDAKTFFGASIPLTKALSREVLVAFEMNGEPLTAEHGFPLRMVVPGYIGARSVKWLTGITVQDRPSDNYFQQHDYRLLPIGTDEAGVEAAGGPMLGDLPVNSAILVPADGAELPPARRRSAAMRSSAAGARWSGSMSRPTAALRGTRPSCSAAAPGPGPSGQAEVDLRPGPATIVVRAWDSAAQAQPERLETVWNCRGYMNNAWHRIGVTVRGV